MTDENSAQANYWTSAAGLKWIEHEHALDTAMAGMLEAVLDAATLKEDDRLLDIGCGTGASTLAAAKRVSHGDALGVDISKPPLHRAESRAKAAGLANASFLLVDAQTHSFLEEAFDVLVSRIGMSFFLRHCQCSAKSRSGDAPGRSNGVRLLGRRRPEPVVPYTESGR